MFHLPQHFLTGRLGERIEGLILDMDGTILDTREYHMAAWRKLIADHDYPPEWFEAAETGFGKTNWAIFDAWFGPGKLSVEERNALSDEKEEDFRELIAGREKARPGLRELLEKARDAGMRVALATSGPRANAEFLIEDLGLTPLFDAMVWGDAAIKSKPHPEPFLIAARRLGVAPNRCVAFEDSRHGFWSAARAGMPIVALVEQPADWLTSRKWTPHVMADFRPVPALLGI